MIKELKDTIENLQDVSEDYINKSPIYNIIHEEIEQVKIKIKVKNIYLY